jgi:endonuclease/exonuclease/phosphatase family metal-dependent hydrolase
MCGWWCHKHTLIEFMCPPTLCRKNDERERTPPMLRIATFNLFTAVPEPIRFNGQTTRLAKVPALLERLEQGRIDVFILCECMLPSVEEQLWQPLRERGWAYVTRPLVQSDLLPSVVNGGVFIVSRYPILEESLHIYHASCMPDTLAAKGVVYARIRPPMASTDIHVLGTHCQAWDDNKQRRIRLEQAHEIATFRQHIVDSSSSSSSSTTCETEPWFLGGDLNICPFTQRDDFTQFLQVTGFACPRMIRHRHDDDDAKVDNDDDDDKMYRYSVSRTNHLVGLDDPQRYKSSLWPQGCETIYLDTLYCPCATDKWLDFVLVRNHKQWLDDMQLQVCDGRVDTYRLQMNATTFRDVSYVSDHAPVVGRFVFSNVDTNAAPLEQRFDAGDASIKSMSSASLPIYSSYRELQSQQWKRHDRLRTVILSIVMVIVVAAICIYFYYRDIRGGSAK